jgi:hypothetical protein
LSYVGAHRDGGICEAKSESPEEIRTLSPSYDADRDTVKRLYDRKPNTTGCGVRRQGENGDAMVIVDDATGIPARESHVLPGGIADEVLARGFLAPFTTRSERRDEPPFLGQPPSQPV